MNWISKFIKPKIKSLFEKRSSKTEENPILILEKAVSRESPTTLNLQEGKCTYGDAFSVFMRTNITDRDCDLVNSKITRAAVAPDPISNTLAPIGTWTEVRPDYVNQSSLEYQGGDWSFNYRLETENKGDFYFNVL